MLAKTLAAPTSLLAERVQLVRHSLQGALSNTKEVVVYLHPSDASAAFSRLLEATGMTTTCVHGGSFPAAYALSNERQIPAVQLLGFGKAGEVPTFSAQISAPILEGKFQVNGVFAEPFTLKLAQVSDTHTPKLVLGPKPILDQLLPTVPGERIAVSLSAGDCAKWLAGETLALEKILSLDMLLENRELSKKDCAVAAMPGAFQGLPLQMGKQELQQYPIKYYMLVQPHSGPKPATFSLETFDFAQPVVLGTNILAILPK